MTKENFDYEELSDSALGIKFSIYLYGLLICILIILAAFIYVSYNQPVLTLPLIFSMVVASISLFISWLADSNTKKMARANLRGIVRNAFTSRYTFFEKMNNFHLELMDVKRDADKEKIPNILIKGMQHMEFATWDMVLCLRQANILREWANPGEKNTLAQSLYILINNVLQQKSNKILKNRHVEHLLISCNELIKIGVNKKFEKDIADKFEEYSRTKKECTECFQDYVKRKLDEVRIDPKGKLETKKYIDKLFMGFK